MGNKDLNFYKEFYEKTLESQKKNNEKFNKKYYEQYKQKGYYNKYYTINKGLENIKKKLKKIFDIIDDDNKKLIVEYINQLSNNKC